MPKLFLLRHIKSQWNKENRFAGWTDGPLDEAELYDAKMLATKTFGRFKIDRVYCSSLFRNMETIARMLEYGNNKYPMFVHLDKGKMKDWGKYASSNNNEVKVFVSESLNERYYGKLQGINKRDAMQEYGKEKVHLWRRSYNIAPPGGESLKMVFKRVSPFYKKYVEKDLRGGKNVLIVASHNSLRAIAKHVENIPDKKIINFEISYAGLVEYNFDKRLKLQNKNIS